jgi:hypothetical protein
MQNLYKVILVLALALMGASTSYAEPTVGQQGSADDSVCGASTDEVKGYVDPQGVARFGKPEAESTPAK